MNIRNTMTLFAIVTVLACGCTTRKAESEKPTTKVQIETSSGTFVSEEAAQVRATFGTTSTIDLWFKGILNGKLYSFTSRLTLDQLLAGVADISLGGGPLADGGGSVQLIEGTADARVESTTGKVSLVFGDQKLTGTITAEPHILSGTMTGTLWISCWVPASALPSGLRPESGTTSAGDPALVADAAFESDACRKLKPIAAAR